MYLKIYLKLVKGMTMKVTLLWESSLEEQIKDTKVFGRSAWEYTQDLLEIVDGQYTAPSSEDYQLFFNVRENRSFSVQGQNMPKMPVLYFVGHYPSLPKALFQEFMEKAKTAEFAVLYTPSLKWLGEKEVVCLFYQGQTNKGQTQGAEKGIEMTLSRAVPRFTDERQIPQIEKALCRLRNQELMERGVWIIDPESVWIDYSAEVAAGVTLYAGSRILGASKIGEGCRIGPNCEIRDTIIGKGNTIVQSQIEESVIAEACQIGPFSYIRPNSTIGSRVRIGDFVEIKNSGIGDDTMISHLTYVGDADVGNHVNFGCGTILVNFNGISKNRSTIEDHAFIGCNSNLVSPVHIGKGAFIAAGSTITQDLPADSLGIARVRQQVKEHWVTKRKTIVEGGKTNEQS